MQMVMNWAVCYLFLGLVEFSFYEGSEAGFNAVQVYAKGAVYLLVGVMSLLAMAKNKVRSLEPVPTSVLLFLLACVPGLMFGESVLVPVGATVSLIMVLFATYATFLLSSSSKDVLQRIFWSGGVIAVLSIIWVYTPFHGDQGERMRGVLGNANGLAQCMLFIVTIGVTLRFGRGWGRVLKWLVVAVCLVIMYKTGSRTSIMALAVTLVLYYALFAGSVLSFGARVLLLLIFVGGVVLVSPYILDMLSGSRVIDTGDLRNLTGRDAVWRGALKLFEESPVFGYGFRGAEVLLPRAVGNGFPASHAHSMYLEILLSGGVLGAMLFIYMLLKIVLGVRMAMKVDSEVGALASILLIQILFQGVTERMVVGTVNVYYFVLCVLCSMVSSCSITRLNNSVSSVSFE